MPQTEEKEVTASLSNKLQCSNCGATLQYEPGTHHLRCSYCGTMNEIAATDNEPIASFDYQTYIADLQHADSQRMAMVVHCKNCGASTTLPPEVTSDNCAFCASPLVVTDAQRQQLVKPHYVLPFLVAQTQALQSFRTWLSKLWFAPSDLSKMVSGDAKQFKGVYLPHWSFDTNTSTEYYGSRGDYYYVTETYTENVDGEEVVRTREVRHTAWSPASGRVDYPFADVLVSASQSLPQDVSGRLEPWRMEALVAYNEQYLSGFRSELYQLDAEQGLQVAKQRMEPSIRDAVRNDIGGDEQVINSMEIAYNDVALKYILLPVWISAYRYEKKLYHFTVNACTGEVVGERPYSAVKIALAVIAALAIIITIIVLVRGAN